MNAVHKVGQFLLTPTFFFVLMFTCPELASQNMKDDGSICKTQCGVPTGQERFPLDAYVELPFTEVPDSALWADVHGTKVSWGSVDVRYSKVQVPVKKIMKRMCLDGWRGEKIAAQALVWTREGIDNLTYEITDFRKGKDVLPSSAFEAGFLRYVMTDGLNLDGKGGCGPRPDHTVFDSTMVADVIDHHLLSTNLKEMQNQALWVSCSIPHETVPGTYSGKIIFSGKNGFKSSLDLSITVNPRQLPFPSDWKFHLDLWQNPYAVARYYQVPVWSKAHLDAMRPIMERLAAAGQKVITASIMHKPWNGQTEDYFESMVTWFRKLDGSWEFSFDVFDLWVEFMMSCGIDRQINCYSMVPWKLSFQYFDQATNSLQKMELKPGSEEYHQVWVGMLQAFSKHLRQKGWFEKCTIAMDERPMKVMKKTIDVIRNADPEFKISMAGNNHPEIENNLYDYCVSIGQVFSEEVISRRRSEGKLSTFYTSCTEVIPNVFTFSEPAEAAWMGYFAAANGLDGYLRWAFNSWPLEPLLDSRFRTWAAGDTFFVYPGNRTSIRFERLLEGIQAWEKIRILREEFNTTGNKRMTDTLEKALDQFHVVHLYEQSAAQHISDARRIIGKF